MDSQPHIQAIFSTALAELNHGMLSCLLLMESFRRFKGGDPYQNWKIECNDFDKKNYWIQKSYMTSQYILKPIAYHSIDATEVSDIYLSYFWVFIVDDLIEGYRPTRAGKDFISQSTCKVKVHQLSVEKAHICYEFTKVVIQKDEKNKLDEIYKIDDDIFYFFVDKLERYYFMLKIKNFDFFIEVKTKREGENDGVTFSFKIINNEKFIEINNQKVPNDIINIEDLLMSSKQSRITKFQEGYQKFINTIK